MTSINAVGNPQLTTNGQLIIGQTGASPLVNTITAGSGITVTNGAGSITVAATGGGGGVSQGLISGNYYVCGTYFNCASAAFGVGPYATGTLYFLPFFITTGGLFKNIGMVTSTPTAGGTTVMGVYNDNGNCRPTGSPITNSNSTSVANSTNTFVNYTFSSPITLSAGMSWVAFSCSAACSYQGLAGGSGSGPQISACGMGLSTLTAASVVPQAGWSQTFVYSATLPAVGSLTAFNRYAIGDSFVWLQAN